MIPGATSFANKAQKPVSICGNVGLVTNTAAAGSTTTATVCSKSFILLFTNKKPALSLNSWNSKFQVIKKAAILISKVVSSIAFLVLFVSFL